MNSKSTKQNKRSQRKRSLMLRRFLVISLCLVFLVLLLTLGWFVYRGIAQAVATGDKPVSDAPTTTTTEVTTTTTKPTYPTIAINAPLSTPRVILYDVTHDSLLYSRGADERCYPASLTKLLTATIVTEQCTPTEEFTVGTELSLVLPGSSTAKLLQGYRLSRDMIIDALLLPSGNDAAYTVAVHIGRKTSGNPTLSDIEAARIFLDLMNQTAQKLGAVNSHFSNPDGFFAPDHYTTAADMLLIAKNAASYANLRESMAKTSMRYTLLSGQDISWTNSNVIINPNSPYHFEGATGMKTGFTDEAGYCVAASAKRNGVDMIAIVMGGLTGDSRWKDVTAILNEAYTAEASHQ